MLRLVSQRLEAVVRNGRIVLDEPTELPEGTIVELTAVPTGNQDDELDDGQRAALHAALARSAEQMKAGESIEAAAVLARLRAKRKAS